MKLTPIRVRGKRGQPKRPVHNSSTKRKAAEDLELPSLPSDRTNKRRRSKNCGGGQLVKGVSRLLQLPQEILERVYIASENLELSQVNRELYQRLSSDSMHKQDVIEAFSPTWDASFGVDNDEKHPDGGWVPDPKNTVGNPEKQSRILEKPWATVKILMEAQEMWIRKHARGRPYFTIPELKKELQTMTKAPEPGSLYSRAYFESDCQTTPGNASSSNTMTQTEKFEFDLNNFLAYNSVTSEGLAHPRYADGSDWYLRALLGAHVEVHPGTKIPDTLLQGPYQDEDGDRIEVGEDKMRRLFWLVRGGACLQPEQSHEITKPGYDRIMKLIEHADPQTLGVEESLRWIRLAERLCALFKMLGIFVKWPNLTVQKAKLETRRVKASPEVLPASPRRYLLEDLERTLLEAMSVPMVPPSLGLDWRWNLDPDENDRKWYAQHQRDARTFWAQFRQQRARIFLEAPKSEGSLPSSSAGALSYGGVGVALHEPYSDFGDM